MWISAALIGPYELAVSACAAEIDEMITKAASPRLAPPASRNGRAASNACTAPSTSSRKFCSQDEGSPPCAIAPALENSKSTPPSSFAAFSIQDFSAAPSVTSTGLPVALMPLVFNSATVAAT